MSKRKEHVEVGMACGAAIALVTAAEQPPENALLEVLGGVAGGYAGGRFPDVLEPAFTPRHRSIAHSMTAGVGLAAFAFTKMGEAQSGCRRRASDCRQWVINAEPGWERFWNSLLYIFWELAAGFVAGFTGGYVSHLVLDSNTSPLPVLA